MCYIQLTIKADKHGHSTNVEQVLRQQIAKEMQTNKDGFYLKNGKAEVKTLDRKQAELGLRQMDMDGLLVHCRLATQGEVSVDNIHGYGDGQWLFVHNGWAYGCNGHKEKSDSRIFFELLSDNLRKVKSDKAIAKRIQKAVLDYEFHGRAILLDTQNDRAFLFGDFEAYLIDKMYLAICSTTQAFEAITIPYTIGGLYFEDRDGISFDVLHTALDGIYVLNGIHSDKFKFRYIQTLQTPSSYGRGGWDGTYDSDYRYHGYFDGDDYRDGKKSKVCSIPDIGERYYFTEGKFRYYCTEATQDEGFYDLTNQFHSWDELGDLAEYDDDDDLGDTELSKKFYEDLGKHGYQKPSHEEKTQAVAIVEGNGGA